MREGEREWASEWASEGGREILQQTKGMRCEEREREERRKQNKDSSKSPWHSQTLWEKSQS